MISIAGKDVKVGDRLYHKTFKSFGKVKRYDKSGSAVFEVERKPYGKRELYITDGGKVGGHKEIFWHEPLFLDVPDNNVHAIQVIVDAVADKLYGGETNER